MSSDEKLDTGDGGNSKTEHPENVHNNAVSEPEPEKVIKQNNVKQKFLTQTEALLRCETKADFNDLIKK